MEQTILQEVASHGSASWLLTRLLFLTGLVALLVASMQTTNPWIMVGIISVTFAEAINQRRLSDPDDPTPSWWPWA